LIRVILDTTILISAFLWSKRVSKSILPLIEGKKILICFSLETIDELLGVLSRKEFFSKFSKIDITPKKLVNELINRENVLVIKKPLLIPSKPIIKEDPSDDKFLYLAIEAEAKYIISGDKHLLKLKEFKGIKIVSVDEFLPIFSLK